MSKQDSIKAEGTVIEAFRGDRFSVELDNGVTILATISGRLWQRHIRVIPGDRVQVELSPYDLTHGRISYRFNVRR
jgi:translation initiation factor IF-1